MVCVCVCVTVVRHQQYVFAIAFHLYGLFWPMMMGKKEQPRQQQLGLY